MKEVYIMLPLKKLRETKQMTQAELGKALGISPSAIGMYEQGRRMPDVPTLKKISAYFKVSLDYLLNNTQEIDTANDGDFFTLEISDHSMEPRILAGDIVTVRRQNDVDNGDVAIIQINHRNVTCKRVKKQKDGITLIATNTSVYEPHFYSNKEIQSLPVQILGKVVELRGKV